MGAEVYDRFVDMLVFDALIYFDNGLSLFSYGMADDFENFEEYAKTRSSAYGASFENIVREFVTTRQKEQLLIPTKE